MVQTVAIALPARRSRRGAGEREDTRLVASLRAQDPAVAGPLVRRFVPTISRLLRWTLGPKASIDVAVQVVLLCVFHRARSLKPGSDLRPFIVRATARVARAELRRTRAGSPSRRGWRPALPAPERQAVERFYRILDRLTAADRIAFVFHTVEEVEVRDIAAALGDTALVTRRRLARVLRAVHDGIQGDRVLRRLTGSR
jgi:DNA-directed RNA polymerase specialized sigma24 family protein